MHTTFVAAQYFVLFKLIVLKLNSADQTVSLYDVPGTVCHDYKSS